MRLFASSPTHWHLAVKISNVQCWTDRWRLWGFRSYCRLTVERVSLGRCGRNGKKSCQGCCRFGIHGPTFPSPSQKTRLRVVVIGAVGGLFNNFDPPKKNGFGGGGRLPNNWAAPYNQSIWFRSSARMDRNDDSPFSLARQIYLCFPPMKKWLPNAVRPATLCLALCPVSSSFALQ